jgi:hypothetical protein
LLHGLPTRRLTDARGQPTGRRPQNTWYGCEFRCLHGAGGRPRSQDNPRGAPRARLRATACSKSRARAASRPQPPGLAHLVRGHAGRAAPGHRPAVEHQEADAGSAASQYVDSRATYPPARNRSHSGRATRADEWNSERARATGRARNAAASRRDRTRAGRVSDDTTGGCFARSPGGRSPSRIRGSGDPGSPGNHRGRRPDHGPTLPQPRRLRIQPKGVFGLQRQHQPAQLALELGGRELSRRLHHGPSGPPWRTFS